mmetsp:Transcript_37590/g.43786  ORF Transcript_37590/g.43786 Transcript_37590/m.43786 type:complete len:89 (-) Transcript_37590:161-427(-)
MLHSRSKGNKVHTATIIQLKVIENQIFGSTGFPGAVPYSFDKIIQTRQETGPDATTMLNFAPPTEETILSKNTQVAKFTTMNYNDFHG